MATLQRNLKLNPKWKKEGESSQKKRLTKILCTIGPKTSSVEALEKLIEEGMDVCWLNLAHGTHREHQDAIQNLRKALKNKGGDYQCSIVAEIRGPKIRTGTVKNGHINLVSGQEIIVTSDTSVIGDEKKISIDLPDLTTSVKDKILIEDGQLLLNAKNIDLMKKEITCIVANNYTLGDNKIVHIPGAVFNLPAVSEKDKDDILFALSQGIHIICAPIRTPWNLQQIRDVMREQAKSVKLIAKIESTEGIDNFDMILNACDGIVVSRGDLGVELPMEQVFKAQKMLTSKCSAASKPVIVSSQMLESMIKNPRPTRAEATDVANAVLDGTECVMLSAETSIGDYPNEALTYMNHMCIEAELVEAVSDYPSLFEALKSISKSQQIPEVIGSYSVRVANDLKAALLIILTETGNTARLVCKYRPRVPVLCVTHTEGPAHFLSLTRGATPLIIPNNPKFHTSDYIKLAMEYAKKTGLAKQGDKVVCVTGVVEGISGQSNSFKVIEIP